MQKIMFQLLIVNKEALASAMSSAFQAGESANALMLTVEGNLYTTFDVPSDIQSVQAVVHAYGKAPLPSGYGHRAMQPGDIILDSNGKALVLAGEGDFNDVTGKISGYVSFPKDPNAANPVLTATAEEDEDEDEDPENEDGEQSDPGIVKASSLRGAVAKGRNCERKEMQALMTDAIGNMFQAQNIPLNQDHSRRAIRAAMRIGIRQGLETGQNLGSLLQLFGECIQKESKSLNKKTGKLSVAMVQIDDE